MAVAVPTAGVDIHFHIALSDGAAFDPNQGLFKVGPAFGPGETRVNDLDGASVAGLEPVAQEALMQPDGLKQPFGRQAMVFAKALAPARMFANLKVPVGVFRHRPACEVGRVGLSRPRWARERGASGPFEPCTGISWGDSGNGRFPSGCAMDGPAPLTVLCEHARVGGRQRGSWMQGCPPAGSGGILPVHGTWAEGAGAGCEAAPGDRTVSQP